MPSLEGLQLGYSYHVQYHEGLNHNFNLCIPYMWHQTANTLTLLNSEATENFIDKQMIVMLELGT